MKSVDILKEFSNLVGISGDEVKVSRKLNEYFSKYNLEIIYDNLGSIFAVKRCGKENAKKVMIATNLDEVGFVIKDIDKNGYLKVLELGSIKMDYAFGQRVSVVCASGEEVLGIITSSDNKKAGIKNSSEILIDIGAKSKEEVLKSAISIGDKVYINGDFKELLNGERVISKALSSRYGCCVIAEILEAIKDEKLDFDLYIGGIVQNKVGFRGSLTSTYLVKPDFAVTLEVLEANDMKKSDDTSGVLGDGAVLCYYDKSMMPNRAVLSKYSELCDKENIKTQFYYSMDSSDAGWIHKMFEGCPVLKAGIVGKNLNTGNEMIDLADYKGSKDSIIKFIMSLKDTDIEMFKTENR